MNEHRSHHLICIASRDPRRARLSRGVQLVFARQLGSHTPVESDVRNGDALVTIVGKHLPARCGV